MWWDRTIPPGSTFDRVIEQALDSARCVVVLWSATSAASDWVKTEAAAPTPSERSDTQVQATQRGLRSPLQKHGIGRRVAALAVVVFAAAGIALGWFLWRPNVVVPDVTGLRPRGPKRSCGMWASPSARRVLRRRLARCPARF